MAGSTEYNFQAMFDIVNKQSQSVQDGMKELQANTDKAFDTTKMFNLQLQMNLLSQFSEGTSGVMAAIHSASSSIARKISQ